MDDEIQQKIKNPFRYKDASNGAGARNLQQQYLKINTVAQPPRFFYKMTSFWLNLNQTARSVHIFWTPLILVKKRKRASTSSTK